MTNTSSAQDFSPTDAAQAGDDVAGFLDTKTAVITAGSAGGSLLGGAVGAGVVAAAAGVGLAIKAATGGEESGPKVAPGT